MMMMMMMMTMTVTITITGTHGLKGLTHNDRAKCKHHNIMHIVSCHIMAFVT